MVDVARDARWGRIVEGAGEDPYLGAAMAAAQVRGFQGPYLGSPDRVLACAKHFAAYGAAEGGRDYDPVYVPEGQLRNVYFPPFHAAVEAGVGSFMSAYMDLNDVPAAGNRWLLRDVLRGEWGFPGFVVSDAMGVGNLVTRASPGDRADAARRAVAAGLDMEMASGTFPEHLARLVSEGAVPVAQVDDAVRRVLAVKVRLGLFESPYADESKVAAVLADPAHREEARLAAQRSMVLLRNERKLLPAREDRLEPGRDRPARRLEGRHRGLVDGVRPRSGRGDRPRGPPGEGAGREGHARPRAADPPPGPVVLRGVRARPEAKPPRRRRTAEAAFQQAVATARGADVVIAVMGELANMSGEAASRASLDLPGRQEELLKAVVGPRQARRPRAPERPAR